VFNPFKEFRMGYRLSSSTWRAPIQLIDSWLPSPGLAPSTRKASHVVQLFARAGWLNHPVTRTPAPDAQHHPLSDTVSRSTASTAAASTPSTSLTAAGCTASAATPNPSRPCHVRVLRTTDAGTGCRTDARLVISGRISDVCAELERLASMEFGQRHPN
jgi:hypothetical protein